MENQQNHPRLQSDTPESASGLSMKTIWILVAINALVSAVISLLVVLIVGPWVFSGTLSGLSTVNNNRPIADETPHTVQSAPTQTTALPTSPPEPEIYVVKPGDSLSLIAENYNVSLDDLMALNTIDNPNTIQAGQNLMIPVTRLAGTSATTPSSIAPTHTPLPFDPPSSNENFTPPPQDVSLTATPSPSPIPSATPLPIGTILVSIDRVEGYGNLEKEAIEIQNNGPAINLYGWKLEGSSIGTYVFPNKTVFLGGRVSVNSTKGTDSDFYFYWNLDEAAWHSGDTIKLVNVAGEIMDSYNIP